MRSRPRHFSFKLLLFRPNFFNEDWIPAAGSRQRIPSIEWRISLPDPNIGLLWLEWWTPHGSQRHIHLLRCRISSPFLNVGPLLQECNAGPFFQIQIFAGMQNVGIPCKKALCYLLECYIYRLIPLLEHRTSLPIPIYRS